MNSVELLTATQKAMGDGHLFKQHARLISKRDEAKTRAMVRRRRLLHLPPGLQHTCLRPQWRNCVRQSGTPPRMHPSCMRSTQPQPRRRPPHARLCASPLLCDPPSLPQGLATRQSKLGKLEADNKALERDAERFKRRQTIQRKLNDIGVKVRQG